MGNIHILVYDTDTIIIYAVVLDFLVGRVQRDYEQRYFMWLSMLVAGYLPGNYHCGIVDSAGA